MGAALLVGALGTGSALCADATVEGVVLTEKGVPVMGFPVVITNEENQVVAVTDEAGRFAAEGLAPGTYEAHFAQGSTGPVEFVVPESGGGFLSLGGAGSPTSIDLGTINVPTGGYGGGAPPAD